MLFRTVLVTVGTLGFAPVAHAQDASSARPPGLDAPAPLMAHRTGEFEAVLSVRSPESEPARWASRFQFPGSLASWDYDLAAQSFSVYVPPAYDPAGAPYGVIVWISARDEGGIPPELRSVLNARHLIWIGPNGAGNSRHLFQRAGLALDAAASVMESYNVDPDQIFVSGLSGGGRVATMLAIDYPEVFAGGFPIVGVTTYLDVPLESNPAQRVLQFPRPEPGVLEAARSQPLVIMTGSGDFNREECRLTADAYERDGFMSLHLLDIDGMGHEMPSPENFGNGLDLLLP